MEKNKNEIERSIIFTLKPKYLSQLISEIIFDLELIEEGYTLCYIVDPFDIQMYCYPVGLEVDPKKKYNLFQVADRRLGRDFLFNGLNNKECLLINDYLPEAIQFRKTIDGRLQKNQEIADYVEKVFNNVDPGENVEELIGENLALIASCAIGYSKKGYETFVDLFKDNRIIVENRMPEDSLLIDLLNDEKQFSDSKEYEKELLDIYNLFPDFQIKKYPDQTYTDALAIQRCIRLNKLVSNDSEYSKYAFLYFSSATKSEKLFNSKVLKRYYPKIKKRRINFHRSDRHMFAKYICSDVDRDGYKETIEKLKELKKLVESKNFSSKNLMNENLIVELLNNIDKRRGRFENFGVLSQLNKEKVKILKSLLEKQPQERFIKLREYFKNNKNFQLQGTIGRALNYIQLTLFDDLITFLRSSSANLSILGKDPIEDVNHALPTNFIKKGKEKEKAGSTILQTVIKTLLEKNISEEKLLESFKSQLEVFFTKKDFIDKPEIQLILFVLLMVMPDKGDDDFNHKAYIGVNKIIRQFEIIKSGGGFINKSYYSEELIRDFKYVAAWASRRATKYEEGLLIADLAIQEHPNDPRFHHAQGLIIYSWLVDSESNDTTIDYLPSTITYTRAVRAIEKALELYENNINIYIRSSDVIDSLYNTLAYVCAVVANESFKKGNILKGENMIEKAREKYLDPFKEISGFKDFEFVWSEHPEYLHTESYVEYVEYRQYVIQEVSGSEKKDKIRNSLIAINKAIGYATSLSRFRLLERCIVLKNELDKIQKELDNAF